jgi:hypothetical protein
MTGTGEEHAPKDQTVKPSENMIEELGGNPRIELKSKSRFSEVQRDLLPKA